MASPHLPVRSELDDRAICEALIALIRSGKVIAVRDPADPLGMRLASAEAVDDGRFARLPVEEACRRLRTASN